MIKALVIADDFTGALDTGVQFRAKGSLVRVADGNAEDLFAVADDIQMLIVDAETRHMTPEKAYETVYNIVKAAVKAGVACIYKKTDSGLRGNIGSELTAVFDAAGEKTVHFIPAFPKMGRITRDGVHYINGVPVAQSVFGQDPFEPVRFSSVKDIIASQSHIETLLAGGHVPQEAPGGIVIYDAQSDEEMMHLAQSLKQNNQLSFLAGCAGFAAMLPALLQLERADGHLPPMSRKLLTICGSINPVTIEQLDVAENSGMPRIRLGLRQKLDPSWLDSEDGKASVDKWFHLIRSASSSVLDCGGTEENDEMKRLTAELNMPLEEVRQRIAMTMGGVLRRLLDRGLEGTLLLTGGDTLLAFMRCIHQNTLMPICELTPGVVLSQIRYGGKTYGLLSKSGGFGEKTLLLDLAHVLETNAADEVS